MRPLALIIIEDDLGVADTVCDYLYNSEFSVVGRAFSGADGAELLLRTPCDVLLTDMFLPCGDGLWIIERLPFMGLAKMPRIIATSPVKAEFASAQALSLGAAGVIYKPFEKESFVGELRRLTAAEVKGHGGYGAMVDSHIKNILSEIGIPSHVLGYRYLAGAIKMVALDIGYLEKITTAVYPSVAKEHGAKSPNVERAMRHAIEIAWSRGDISAADKFFGYTIKIDSGKPTNSEFIAMAAENVRLWMSRDAT